MPRITASVSWPVTKLEKVRLVMRATSVIQWAHFSEKRARTTFFRLTGQSLFLGQQIEGEGEGKHQVDHQREDGGGDADGGVEKILSILGEKGGDVVFAALRN